MSITYMLITLTRRKLKYLLLLVIAIALAIYCIAESDGLSRHSSPYHRWNARMGKSIQKKEAQLESPIAKREDFGGEISQNSLDYYEQETVMRKAYKCEQQYPIEAITDFNTFEMYKNGVSSSLYPTLKKSRTKMNKQPLQVFLLPMTHVDPGWLETFDSYTKDTNQILDNMLIFLKKHPKMRFMWCEMVFFERWWSHLNDAEKTDVRQFVTSGQLELASGSWVMTDEANPYFPVTIDNIVEGQQFIFRELGAKAKVIWSNDPFGYGPSVPYLFTKTGVKLAVINRIHHGMKNYLQELRAVPFKWRQYFDARGESDVYTHVLPYAHYDILNSCGPVASVCCEFDFKRLTHHMCPLKKPTAITKENVVERAALFEDQLMKLSHLYESNVLLVMWGDDFRYNMLEEWRQQYDNLSPIFDQINSWNRTRIRFGTFVDYFTALQQFNIDNAINAATLTGDFFPYQCALGDIWTGYYTTRPFYKKQGRHLHALIRATDLATTNMIEKLSDDERKWINDKLTFARRNLSLFQHHDAITGTSKKHVMSNYAQLLFQSVKAVASCLTKIVSVENMMDFEINEVPLQYNQIPSKKLILIEPNTIISVAVYNSVERWRFETISLAVSTYMVRVIRGGKTIQAQIEPFIDQRSGNLTSHFNLIFHADLPPLSTSIFTIIEDEKHHGTVIAEVAYVNDHHEEAVIRSEHLPKVFNVKLVKPDEFFIETDAVRTTHSPENGLINTIRTKSVGEMQFAQTMDHYVNSGGGPYIMHQSGPAVAFSLSGLSRFVIKGPLQQSAYIHSTSLMQRTTVRNVPGNIGEQLHIVMRVDIRRFAQTELITRFNMGLDGNSTVFYTDSNGLQLLRREYNEGVPVNANYYPMPTSLMLQDRSHRVSIVSDVEHGATLYTKTTPEIMLDRILLHDDGKGLGPGDDSILNDVLPVEIGFTIIFERVDESRTLPEHFAYNTLSAHLALQSLLYKPIVLTSKGNPPLIPSSSLKSFPCDLQLVTCRPIAPDLNQRLLILHRPGIDCSGNGGGRCQSIDFTEIFEIHWCVKSAKDNTERNRENWSRGSCRCSEASH
uniref:Alpha-mannosidase n=1 Tax=Parascaris univalens TaxID=6257 RepID=A0A915C586_PARUN